MADSQTTKKALAAAMKELMNSRPFAKISVGDICQRCEMNRKSFYYHFKDKYELVNWIFDTECVSVARDNAAYPQNALLLRLCEYLYENRRFYSNALQVTGQNSFREHFHEVITPLFRQFLMDELGKNVPEEATFIVSFFLDAFLLAVERWLARPDCLPPERFAALLVGAVTGAAHDIVQLEKKAKQV